jgi:hypothetical protein
VSGGAGSVPGSERQPFQFPGTADFGGGEKPGSGENRSNALSDKMDALIKSIEALTKAMEQNASPHPEHPTAAAGKAPGRANPPKTEDKKKSVIDPALIRQGAAIAMRAAAGMFGS